MNVVRRNIDQQKIMNDTRNYELTIIIPVFNEEDNMKRVEEKIAAFVGHAPMKTCVLLVNDGSKDSSLKAIREICKRQPHFYYISSSENHGLSTAMKAGIDAAESRYVGYIDADLQTDPEDFAELLKFAPDYQLVSGFSFQAPAIEDRQRLPPQDDRRHRHRHRVSAQGDVDKLCQAAAVF